MKSSHHSVPMRQLKPHDSRRPWLCSAKVNLVSFQDPSSNLGISCFMMHTCLEENTTNLSHGSCQAVIETLSPGWSKNWFMAHLVMYCGIIVEVRKALGATFVCKQYIPLLKTMATRTTLTSIRATKTIKSTFAISCTFFVHI